MYFSFSAFCFSTFIRPNFYYFTILFVILILLIILLKKDPSALTGKPIPKFLRMGSFFVLLLCLFEPVFNFNSASKQWVLVLVDTSRSMAIGERINKVKQILPLLKFKEVHLKEVWGFDKHPYLLSETPKKAGQDSITATGELTNIGNAILETPTPSAYILLSDGINNCGRDPIIIAQQKGVPIYTVKIGDSITCDASISEIDYDKLVYTGDTVLIKVRLNTIGYNHQKLQVLLKENNYILQEKNMLVSQKVGVQKFEPKIKEVEFRIIPKEAGMHFYEIEISELPVANPVGNSVGNPAAGGAAIGGEINKENNKRAFGIKVIKSRIKVCWFADQPSWNFKFAKLELAQEKDIELDWWIKVKEGG
ncbi:MAG: VWA domain-containing protein [Candidatus Stahlbacteria bacterium]|nr:VWA domain-containing protein [Candidatus Stahlbacteria bacterium]